jgi:peptidyl-dipeptidase A
MKAALLLVVALMLGGARFLANGSNSEREQWRVEALQELEELEKSIHRASKSSAAGSENDITDDSEVGCDSKIGRKRDRDISEWINAMDAELRTRESKLAYSNWDYVTNLTDVNRKKLEPVQNEFDSWFAAQVKTARAYRAIQHQICNSTASRLLKRIVYYSSVPRPNSATTAELINHLTNTMASTYGTATISKAGKIYRLDPELTQIMASSRDYDELLWAWIGWHNVTGRPMREPYIELVRDMSEAARDNGFNNIGESWQMADFETLELELILDDLFAKIKPFYELLHAYVRRKLKDAYPQADIRHGGYIPAHLLGNMWGQQWTSIFDLVVPYSDVPQLDITESLEHDGYTPPIMFRTAEKFFTSLGFEPMTKEFWARSVIVRPNDGRELDCHGSANDFFTDKDFRIKMCTEVTAEDFQTVHHEMGHIEYFMAYRNQPALFRAGANAAFHEAIGDTVALSASTPAHLRAIGLVDESKKRSKHELYRQEINFLMLMALQKVAFLPFAYLVDKWRYAVFRGDVTADNYNQAWWKMREDYQGLKAPVPRTEADFDPGAKYHIPTNVPYSRYFLSFIGQFQFHESLCELAEHEGPLHRCDIYKSTKAGDRLKSVLSLGASQPWPEVMTQFTGQPQFKVDSILRYFKPLISWLKRANIGSTIGWAVDE